MAVNVINQPADLCWQGNCVFMGPTAVDLSPIRDHDEAQAHERSIQDAIRRREAGLFRSWKSQDFRTHTFQQQRRSFRKPKPTD